MAVTMKNAVFWNVKSCSSSKDGRFGGTSRIHHLDDKNRRTKKNVSNN
jgi:hypothetical protein